MKPQIAYKLFRVRKDGTLGSLFIGRKSKLATGEWMEAELIPTKGFKPRFGWHCLKRPHAPHLKLNGRAWFRVEIREWEQIQRPAAQGGTWFLAKYLRILEPLKPLPQTD